VTQGQHPGTPVPATAVPFTSRGRPSGPGLTEEQRITGLLADMARLFDSASRIAARGLVAFTDPADDTQRLAAGAIMIRLSEIAARLPESFRSTHPEAPWNALRAVRNRASHDYRSIDAAIVWEVLDNRLPEFRQTLGI